MPLSASSLKRQGVRPADHRLDSRGSANYLSSWDKAFRGDAVSPYTPDGEPDQMIKLVSV
jgi:hypothetical protein